MSAIEPLESGVPNRTTRTRPQQALLTILLITGVVLVLCLYLLQTTQTTVKTVTIENLQTEYARLQRQNSNLLAIYAHDQSMSQMMEQAELAGFEPVQSVYFLPAEESTVQGERTAAAVPANPADSTSNLSSSPSIR